MTGKKHEHGTTSRRRDARSEVQHHHAAAATSMANGSRRASGLAG
jgi:hypothetical protein